MPISARNQLEGKIVEVVLGDIMAHVVVRIGKHQIDPTAQNLLEKKLHVGGLRVQAL